MRKSIIVVCVLATAASSARTETIRVEWSGPIYPYSNWGLVDLAPGASLNLDAVAFQDRVGGPLDPWGQPTPNGVPDPLPIQATYISVTQAGTVNTARINQIITYTPSGNWSLEVRNIRDWTGGSVFRVRPPSSRSMLLAMSRI